MSEFLIYNKTHWMDERTAENPNWQMEKQLHIDANPILTVEQKIKNKELAARKFNGHSQVGDITEARKDNGPRGRLEPGSFQWVQVPISLKKARQYKKSVLDARGEISVLHKYWLDRTGLVFNENQTVKLTLAEFNNRLRTK